MKKNNDIAIQLTDVTKEYVIHHEKPTLVERFTRGRDEKFVALQHIHLTIRKGDKIGIIGHNGSGKTTMLKIIAGITAPTMGTVRSRGKVISLIDLEAGFHDDLTGEQNIYLNGMLLGMKKKEIDSKLRKIIQFADIKQFIDAPLFTYSSGMKLRLGFAVAINANPDVLIIDEGVTMGDNNFQRKVSKSIRQLYQSNKTIIIVSHWLDYLKKNCTKILWLQNGKIKLMGDTRTLMLYKQACK